MARTRTGSFPIGFRRGWSDWQKSLDNVIVFAKHNGFEGIDVGPMSVEELRKVTSSGLHLGSVDLKQWTDLVSPDASKRQAAIESNRQFVESATAAGTRVFFAVVIPEDAKRPRRENF